MIERRPFERLGGANHGWLDTKHHFSFSDYQDPKRMNWGRLRVWNDDTIAPDTGFPPHPHQDMEIITYVTEGAVTHQDSLGNKGRTEAGDVQVMSAGTGIRHAEYNREPETTKLFQIWILPTKHGPFRRAIAPGSSSPWPAALRTTPKPCRSVPMRGCWAPPCTPAKPSTTPSARTATAISSRPKARSRSTASSSTLATVRRSAARMGCGYVRSTMPNWCWSTPPE